MQQSSNKALLWYSLPTVRYMTADPTGYGRKLYMSIAERYWE